MKLPLLLLLIFLGFVSLKTSEAKEEERKKQGWMLQKASLMKLERVLSDGGESERLHSPPLLLRSFFNSIQIDSDEKLSWVAPRRRRRKNSLHFFGSGRETTGPEFFSDNYFFHSCHSNFSDKLFELCSFSAEMMFFSLRKVTRMNSMDGFGSKHC